MRDLRADLKERLGELDARTSELTREYNRAINELQANWDKNSKAIEEERRFVAGLLKIEQDRHGEVVQEALPNLPLAEFFVRRARRMGKATKEQLKSLAGEANYFSDGDTGGRTTHTTLLNLVRARRLEEIEDGVYRAPPVGADTIMGQGLNDPKQANGGSIFD